MNYIGMLFFLSIIICILVLIPFLIGRYVYKDAKNRGMDAVLWVLVAIFVPGFIGLIIYLVIRSNNTNLNCKSCKKPISSEYLLCPYCGIPLKTACPACDLPVNSDWRLCPKCGAELTPEKSTNIDDTPIKKDRKLITIIIAAIFIPILLFIFLIFAIRTGSKVAMIPSYIYWEYRESDYVEPLIREWMADCDKAGEGVYVLELSSDKTDEILSERLSQNHGFDYLTYIYINYQTDGKVFEGSLIDPFNRTGRFIMNYNTVDKIYEDSTIGLTEIAIRERRFKRITIFINDIEVNYAIETYN